MTKETISQFLESRPAVSKSAFCREVGEDGITPQYLNMILRGERPVSDDLAEKIGKVMKKYGYNTAK